MKIFDMTKEDFEHIPHRKWAEDVGEFKSLVIVPTEAMHDSGFQCMDFVAVDGDDEPIAFLSGCSDVVHIGGVMPMSMQGGWHIDCLPCGYLRLFNTLKRKLSVGPAVSSFEVFCRK